MEKVKNVVLTVNTVLLVVFGFYLFKSDSGTSKIHKEIKAERLSIVGPDGHLYISISNPERQTLATVNGKPLSPGTNRDLPGIIFFNRIGDELGGIYHDGTEGESFAGITFDQQKDDQILAIMKDEYKEDGKWKRWYGMFLRERSDSISQFEMFQNFYKETEDYSKEQKEMAYRAMRKLQDEEINVYRMFLGREENENVGLFLYDSKGRERIKLYVDADDRPKLTFLDEDGNEMEQFQTTKGEGVTE
ncbi:hypothetical protein [uncultured Croceitalea sp.]|uniref:hypothetical protein n=1 Tax=uncultured Croceitalea sp. TaxID=1798908 RepID=UPI0033063270